jgi:hypothetical protein
MVLDLVLLYQVLLPVLRLVHEDAEPNIANKVHSQASICQQGLLYLSDEELNCPLLLSMVDA